MTTAAPETQADRLESLLERLTKKESITDIQTVQKSMGAMVSYMEEDDTPPMKEKHYKAISRGRAMKRVAELRSNGYQRQVRSFGDMLRGLHNRETNDSRGLQFVEAYEATKKSLLAAMVAGVPESDMVAQMKAISMNTFEADRGGSLVLPEFSKDILTREYDFLDLVARTKGYTVGGNSMTFPKLRDSDRRAGQRSGGVAAKWTGEEESMSESRPAFDELSLKLNKLTAIVYVTQEMIDDYYGNSLAGYVSDIVSDELHFRQSDSIIRGTGVKQPLGILNSPGRVAVSKESGQSGAVLEGLNILEMYRRRITSKSSKYMWLVNQNVEVQLQTMQLGSGEAAQLDYRPPAGLADKPHGTLQGLPIVPCEFCSPLGTEGDIILWCPDEYLTISKGGIVEDTSIHTAFLTNQVAYRFVIRMDGRLMETTPIIPYQGSATTDTQSSVITLETR